MLMLLWRVPAPFRLPLLVASALGCNQITGAADLEISEPSAQSGSGGAESPGNGGSGNGNGGSGNGDGSGGTLPNGGAYGNGGNLGLGGAAGNGGSGIGVCQPGSVRACAAAGCDSAGEQSCNLDGSGYGVCVCTAQCAAQGAACANDLDCCGGASGGALCINGACNPTCFGDEDCSTCCLTWFIENTFIGRACGDVGACTDNLGLTPIGTLCGGNAQCSSFMCDVDLGLCYAPCTTSAECGELAVCFVIPGEEGLCFPNCAVTDVCPSLGLTCSDVPTAEGVGRACIPGL